MLKGQSQAANPQADGAKMVPALAAMAGAFFFREPRRTIKVAAKLWTQEIYVKHGRMANFLWEVVSKGLCILLHPATYPIWDFQAGIV